jgi:hypothetical protein
MLVVPRRLCVSTMLLGLLVACDGGSGLSPESTASSDILAAAGGTPKNVTDQIKLVLDLQPDGPTDVKFSVTGDKRTNALLDDDNDPTLSNVRLIPSLKPGTYTVTAGPTTPYLLTGIFCGSNPNGGSGVNNNTYDIQNRTVTIQLESLESVTCVFHRQVALSVIDGHRGRYDVAGRRVAPSSRAGGRRS